MLRDNGDDKMTSAELFEECSIKALKIFFNALANGSKYSTAIRKAIKRYDSLWVENSNRLILDYKPLSYDGKLLTERISSIYDPKLDEIVAVNFPIAATLRKDLIVTDTLDLLLIRREGFKKKKQTIRGIIFFEYRQ
jgi:hypothetical protein